MMYNPAPIRKMASQLNDVVDYFLPIGEEKVHMNPLIGQHITLSYSGKITCLHCDAKTKKSYSQGYCYPCMTKLAQCDMCIMKPETCHYDKGTCREPEWGEQNCMIPHYVYLSNTSGLKVGITRHTQIPTRWIDQGAIQAMPIFKVQTRLQSGLVETSLAKFIADKTNWRTMLKGETTELDLKQKAEELKPKIKDQLSDIALNFGSDAVVELDEEVININYPVNQYPTKINSHNFDKTPDVSGVLVGIKGQYLIFDTGVINMRKFTSYHVGLQIN